MAVEKTSKTFPKVPKVVEDVAQNIFRYTTVDGAKA